MTTPIELTDQITLVDAGDLTSEETARFVRTFRSTWAALPEDVRPVILQGNHPHGYTGAINVFLGVPCPTFDGTPASPDLAGWCSANARDLCYLSYAARYFDDQDLAALIAHELAHATLHSRGHSHHTEAEAVALNASWGHNEPGLSFAVETLPERLTDAEYALLCGEDDA